MSRRRAETFSNVFLLLFLQSLSIPASSQINVTTFHYDTTRKGANIQENRLTPANVNAAHFGKLFTTSVDGYVVAQPLYLARLNNIAGGTHNVLYVATEHDSVFAIDADDGAILWQRSFIDPGNGITTVSDGDVNCLDIVPEMGISSTPVIDISSGTLYVVAKTNENGQYVQRLHALDVASGAEKLGGPVVIAASVNGNGDGGKTVNFNPLKQNNRAALLLNNGHVVIGWGSHCDNPQFHGWVMSYSAATLAQEAVFNTTPDGAFAGVWMGGDGIAADSDGYYYFATGNGTYNFSNRGYGDSIMKMAPAANGVLPVVDSFTPWNQNYLANHDLDIGSGGLLLLPDLPPGSPHPHLLAQMGKNGVIYLVDRDRMGGYCSTCINIDTQIVQEINDAGVGTWGSPAYWNGNVYWTSDTSPSPSYLTAFSFNAGNSGLLSSVPTSRSPHTFGYGTGAPTVSANGTTNGILWLLDNGSYLRDCCQVLYAFDALDLSTELYDSNQAAGKRDVPGGAVKFTAPVIANGKVYAGGQREVSAYGSIIATESNLVSNLNPAYVTESITYTATVTAEGSIPSGSVTFYSGSKALATLSLKNGKANYSTSFPSSGVYVMTASFSGTTGSKYSPSVSAALRQVVNPLPAATTSTLKESSAAVIYVGQPVSLTDTVSSTFGTPANGEKVTFVSGGASIGTALLSGGVANFSTSALAAGTHTIRATYAGDADFKASSADATVTIDKYPTTIVLSATPNPSAYAQPVTLTGKVTSSGPATPIGDVEFFDGTTLLGGATLNSSAVATLTSKQIPLGSNQLTTTYTGASGYIASSSSPLAEKVNQAVISMKLTCSPNPSVVGHSATFVAKLTSNGGLPSGSLITFSYGGNALGTGKVSGSGVASFSTAALPKGSDTVTATYAGSADFSSASASLTQVVNP